tara:strand:+ start:359 stop:622 length:264 start_codon:yes stop_codon:yes gene_type:complete
MKVVPDWKEMNRVLKWTIGAAFTVFISGLVLLSCADEWYLGKSREDLAREMFEVDSLIMTIQMQLDSSSVDFERFYINAQRINNGHD